MSPVTSLDRIQPRSVEPAPTPPRFSVVKSSKIARQRRTVENLLLAFALLCALTFVGAVAKYILHPAITTASGASATTADSYAP